MRTREWSVCLVLAGLAVACGDQPTAPDRELTPGPGTVALATATSEDGLSIVTDKDDYAPGDTVWFTGAGWASGDTLDIVLTDDPTLDSHQWSVEIREDGTFRDSTYVVDTEDLGVTFTLTATSRATHKSLTVIFADAQNLGAATLNGGSAVSVAPNASITALLTVTTTGSGGNSNWSSSAWRIATSPPQNDNAYTCVDTPDHSGAATNSESFSITAPASPGTYNTYFKVFQNANCAGGSGTQSAVLSNSVVVTVPSAATITTVSSSQNPSGSGQSVTFTATVTSGSPAAAVTAGQVAFKLGGTNCADASQLQAGQTVDANGQVTFATSALAIGSHIIRACYGGATGFLASEGSVTQQVNTTATEIDLSSSANPSKTGQSVTFTATVTSNSNPVTTGQLSFKKGGTQCSDATEVQAPANLSSSGQKTYVASFAASESPVTFRACYGGSSSPLLSASGASVVQNVDKAATTTSLSSGLNPSVFSQSVTFSATVAVVSPGVGTPAGSITLKDGTCGAGTELGTSSLNGSGQATFNVSSLSAGSHSVTACYAGNGDFEASNGSVAQTVNKAATTTVLGSSDNPSVFSQAVTFDVTVTPNSPAVATPAGDVVLKNGTCAAGTTIGASTALDGTGKASFNVSSLAVGTHPINACYLGNTNFLASDDEVSQVVNKASTSTGVASTVNPSVFSQSVTFDVTVTPVLPAVATPAGDVALVEGTCSSGTALGGPTALDGTGKASFVLSTLAVGTHTITACYAGNVSFEASDGGISQVVNKASTATALASSANPSILAQPVTFDVTVTPVSPAVATPQGDVTLKEGTCTAGATIGGPTALNASGQTSFTVTTLSAGNHTVSACYGGNASFEGSSNSLTQQVRFNFIGFAPPVDRPNTYNVSKAGQAIPLKWQLQDFFGNPVTTLAVATVKASDQSCTLGTTTDQLEEYASGQSGLQNLGGGYYQFNWKTPPSYSSSCKTIGLDLGEGFVRSNLAFFTFKK
jgi:hypothetical protein